jgi:hypothetical protein
VCLAAAAKGFKETLLKMTAAKDLNYIIDAISERKKIECRTLITYVKILMQLYYMSKP